ncbi:MULTISPECIES: nuclear transport factor 2 family protein [unclassified Streptomyces]|uniref:nuclear transport factor 2 family protein n=1 Tax=unclassified Streptomyces TaxID=2593676 RepID=UPI0022B60FFA|nr:MULTISPECIES: nuclear transport factor 2 family protein [unclassified Streptomyces]MCZ7415988.1 nuclear transport factor 2 family protein [Streptomyces sp. WMMC897]MCZ7434205.1 nuclear transport factor 2 family protein [Streptomyces sp. WMMC1477]
MLDELERKAVALEYVRCINAGDIGRLLKVFADDVRFEDPVGSPPVQGKTALRKHLSDAIKGNVHEIPGEITASQDGRHIAIPVQIHIDNPEDPGGKRLKINAVSVCRLNSAGLIEDVKAFWGQTDVAFVDRDAPISSGEKR